MFWESCQNRHIASAGMFAAAAESKASNAASKVVRAEARAEKAMMICEALWIIVKQKLDLTDEILEKAVKAVDLQDGKLDGKVVDEVSTCSSCGRQVGRNRRHCIYCGTEIKGGVFG